MLAKTQSLSLSSLKKEVLGRYSSPRRAALKCSDYPERHQSLQRTAAAVPLLGQVSVCSYWCTRPFGKGKNDACSPCCARHPTVVPALPYTPGFVTLKIFHSLHLGGCAQRELVNCCCSHALCCCACNESGMCVAVQPVVPK